MSIPPQARKLRTRKLGVLIYDARVASRRAQEECAQALGISTVSYQTIEQGMRAPTLPELELLAYYFNIPIEHFWSSVSLAESKPERVAPPAGEVIPVRQRMVAVQLNQARETARMSEAELAEQTGILEDTLKAYESGEVAIPLPDLEALATTLGTSLDSFLDVEGPVGTWRLQQETLAKISELPPELREFISKPINRPYLDLAMRLSDLSVERLRAIAEGLLEITY